MNAFNASVSVVIPTRNRPRMVLAAVVSALEQTHPPHEVIVVIDGPEQPGAEDTAVLLTALHDERIRVLGLPESVGGAEARNLGVQAATGEWVAFLDDDDLWMPDKLMVQLEYAATLPADTIPVVSCRVLARSPEWDEVWPREVYRTGTSLAEYLFCRRGWRYGAALLQTSTLLAQRDVLLRVPFAQGLKKHQDWDWLLRVGCDAEVRIHVAGALPLAVFHVEGERASVGRRPDWRFSLGWARERRNLLGQRAFAGFLATECAPQAEGQGVWARFELLHAFVANGAPSLADAVRFFVFLCLPRRVRRGLREIGRGVGQPARQAADQSHLL